LHSGILRQIAQAKAISDVRGAIQGGANLLKAIQLQAD
jgi:hypothetical protein